MMEYVSDYKKLKKKPGEEKSEEHVKREKPAFKLPFKPASLHKSAAFADDNITYGETKERLKTLYDLSQGVRII